MGMNSTVKKIKDRNVLSLEDDDTMWTGDEIRARESARVTASVKEDESNKDGGNEVTRFGPVLPDRLTPAELSE